MAGSPGRRRRGSPLTAIVGIQPDWSTVTLVNGSVQQPNLQQLIKSTSTSTEPRLSTVSANLQQAIGAASTTVAAGSATPAQRRRRSSTR